MKIQFKISEVKCEDNILISSLSKIIKELSDMLTGLRYYGTLKTSNSIQLDINLDQFLVSKLSKNNWILEKKPKLNKPVLGENWGNQEVDLVISFNKLNSTKAVVEIEKGNKKTIWFDFIKMWMFIEAKKADLGVLICPLNYAHKLGVWNLFDEALIYKKYLKCFANVPEKKLNHIGIVGYTQMIKNGNKYYHWDKKEFNRIKMAG